MHYQIVLLMTFLIVLLAGGLALITDAVIRLLKEQFSVKSAALSRETLRTAINSAANHPCRHPRP
jgi:Mg2+/Co2+ transporter CorB